MEKPARRRESVSASAGCRSGGVSHEEITSSSRAEVVGNSLGVTDRTTSATCSYSTPKVHVVVECSVCPGRSTVEGNDGSLGESGKCCVSSARPACFTYLTPLVP